MLINLFFRVDGSAQIGLGHLIRSLALAEMLNPESYAITFFCKEIPYLIEQKIIESRMSLIKIDNESEFLNRLVGNEIVILDNYYLGTRYQKEIKNRGSKLVCVDDLQDKEFFADIIICQIPNIKIEDYCAQLYTEYLIGPEYALLRHPFLKAAKDIKLNRDKTLFICFGGTDYNDLTRKSLEIALDLDFEKINVVVGLAYRYFGELQKEFRGNPSVNLYQNLDDQNMIKVMKDSSYAIVPASGILLEVIAVGCITISGYYVDNQRLVYEAYNALGQIISAEDFSSYNIQKALEQCLSSDKKRSKRYIDGNSDRRLRKAINNLRYELEGSFKLRGANVNDVKITYRWATSPVIRKYSFSQEKILFKEHSNWFRSKINRSDTYYYIAELNNKPVGSIRFDVSSLRSEAIISYLLDEEIQGKGYGHLLIKLGIIEFSKRCKQEFVLIGFVMQENISSIKIFERAGFLSSIEENGSLKFKKQIK